jgi:hypothetical protein
MPPESAALEDPTVKAADLWLLGRHVGGAV